MNTVANLPLISVVFVSYNRAYTLVAAYESFISFVDYPRDRLELILSDDASDAGTQRVLEKLEFDKKLIAGRNAGLGANQNKGLKAASGEFHLMVQDDWMLVGRPDFLRAAVRALQENPDIGMILFPSRPLLPVVEERRSGELRLEILGQRGPELKSVHDSPYSDQPHLKRPQFHEATGPYREDVPIHKMEFAMCQAFAAQNRFKVAAIEGMDVFKDIGHRFTWNPATRRGARLAKIRSIPGGAFLIDLARRLFKRER